MSSNVIRFATARRTSRANLHMGWLDGGTLEVYTTPVPANADTAITTQTLLTTHTIPNPSGTVTNGVFTAADFESALNVADGTVGWARAKDSSGVVIGDYDCGVDGSGAAIILDNLGLVSGSLSTVTSFTIAEG